MFSNDIQSHQHLLQWVNKERISLNQNIPLYSLSQINDTDFVQLMLIKINHNFFHGFSNHNHLKFQYPLVLTKIQQYLDKVLGNKLKRRLRNKMLQQLSSQEMIKLLFYLSVQSQTKSQFIHRVFQLPQNTQALLMNDLKDIQENIQSIMEVKDILKKLEQLQQQNDILREQLRQTCCTTNSLTQSLKQNQQERVKLNSQCKTYKKQKDTIFQELGITELKQYAALYKQLKNQNEDLNQTIKHLQKRINSLESQKKDLKDNVTSDNQLISHLNEQVSRFKTLYQNAWLQISSFHQNTQSDIALKQNKTFGNTSERNSKNIKSSQRQSFSSDSGANQKADAQQLRIYNSQLMKKLQQSYRRSSCLNQQNSQLKQQIKLMKKENQRLDKKINDLRINHESFISGYELTISE